MKKIVFALSLSLLTLAACQNEPSDKVVNEEPETVSEDVKEKQESEDKSEEHTPEESVKALEEDYNVEVLKSEGGTIKQITVPDSTFVLNDTPGELLLAIEEGMPDTVLQVNWVENKKSDSGLEGPSFDEYMDFQMMQIDAEEMDLTKYPELAAFDRYFSYEMDGDVFLSMYKEVEETRFFHLRTKVPTSVYNEDKLGVLHHIINTIEY